MNYQKVMQCTECGNTIDWTNQYQEIAPDCSCGNDSWTIFKKDTSIPTIPLNQEYRFWNNPHKYTLPKRLAE